MQQFNEFYDLAGCFAFAAGDTKCNPDQVRADSLALAAEEILKGRSKCFSPKFAASIAVL